MGLSRNGNDLPVYFREMRSIVLKSGSGLRSTIRPRSCASRYGLSIAMIDTPTRASRRVFLALSEPSPVETRIESPSRSTHTGATCGEPSLMSVAKWAKFAPRTSVLTSSESWSGIGTSVVLRLEGDR